MMSRYRRNGKRLSQDSSSQDIIDICSSKDSDRHDLEMIAVSCADRWWPDYRPFGGVRPDVLLSLIFRNEKSDGYIWSDAIDESIGIPPHWSAKYKVFSCISENVSLELEVFSGKVSRKTMDNVIISVYLRCIQENSSFRELDRYLDGPGKGKIERGAHGDAGISRSAISCAEAISAYESYKEESMGKSDRELAKYGLPPRPSGSGYEPSSSIVGISRALAGG